jgi:hypothetical protein
MNQPIRRVCRIVVLLLTAASFAACHFHHCHPMPRFPQPFRHCR